MGQNALLLVILAALTVGTITFTTQRTNQDSDAAASVSQADDFGREAALQGLEQVVYDLVQRPREWGDRASFDVPTTTYGPGTFSARLVDYKHTHGPTNPAPAIEASMVLDDTVTVESVGTFVDGRTGDERRYVIRATYIKGLTDVGIALPSRMAFASDQELRVNGSNDILKGGDYPANIHADEYLNVKGSPVNLNVEGTGSYNTSIRDDPSIYFDGDPPTQQVDPVPFIPTDFSDLSRFTDAEGYTIPPSGTFSTPPSLPEINLEATGWEKNLAGTIVTGSGTAVDPFKWFINGNWDHGNAELRFYVNGNNAFGNAEQAHIEIYVNGNLSISGNGTLTPTFDTAPPSTESATNVRTWIKEHLPQNVSMWIYVNGDVSISGTSSIAARIKANGAVTANGGGNGVNIIGGVEAIGDLTLKGGTTTYMTLPASTGTEPGLNYDVPEGVNLIAYTEWLEGDAPDPAEAP